MLLFTHYSYLKENIRTDLVINIDKFNAGRRQHHCATFDLSETSIFHRVTEYSTSDHICVTVLSYKDYSYHHTTQM